MYMPIRLLKRRTRRSQPINHLPVSRLSGNLASKGTSFTKGPLPLTYRSKLRYAETVAFTTGTAGVIGTTNTWLLGSLFDPNYTGTGHQPMGFDQLAALYSKYRVDSCDITLLFNTLGSTADACCAFAVGAPGVSQVALAGTVDRATESNTVSTCVLSPSGNSRTQTVKFHVDLAKVCGLTRAQYTADDKFQALISASPALSAFLEIGVGSYSGVAAEAVSCQVVIDFNASFFNRIELAQS